MAALDSNSALQTDLVPTVHNHIQAKATTEQFYYSSVSIGMHSCSSMSLSANVNSFYWRSHASFRTGYRYGNNINLK